MKTEFTPEFIIGSAPTAPASASMWACCLIRDIDHEKFLGELLSFLGQDREVLAHAAVKGKLEFAARFMLFVQVLLDRGTGVVRVKLDSSMVKVLCEATHIQMWDSEDWLTISETEVVVFNHDTGRSKTIWKGMARGTGPKLMQASSFRVGQQLS